MKLRKICSTSAKHIVNQKAGDSEPEKFEDHYEDALTELINAKHHGRIISTKARPKADKVVNLMDGLKKSIANEAPKGGKAAEGRSSGAEGNALDH